MDIKSWCLIFSNEENLHICFTFNVIIFYVFMTMPEEEEEEEEEDEEEEEEENNYLSLVTCSLVSLTQVITKQLQ